MLETIDTAGDRDWFKINLQDGQRITIELDGVDHAGSNLGALSDPFVRLYSSNGTYITGNDDGGPGLNSNLTFTVSGTGTYYIEAAAWNDSVAGDYSLKVSTAAPLPVGTLQDMADFLVSGYWSTPRYWNLGSTGTNAKNGILTYTLDGYSSDANGLTAGRAAMVREAFKMYEAVLGIDFQETSSTTADFRFRDNDSGAYAGSSYSVSGGTGFISYSYINIASSWNGGSTAYDSYTFQTILHEIGHALGLGHQGGYNGSANYPNDADFVNDSWQGSMMSYFSQNENNTTGASYATLISPMSVDWISLNDHYAQYGFGVSNAFTGNTVWGFNTNISAATSQVFHDLAQYADDRSFTIIDSGGNDTLDFSGYSQNQRIDLTVTQAGDTQATTSDIGTETQNLTLAVGTVIENAISGGGDDRLIGNQVNNGLYGGGGNDTLEGNGGDDSLYGGGGSADVALFTGSATEYFIAQTGATSFTVSHISGSQSDGLDTLVDVETARFSNADVDLTNFVPSGPLPINGTNAGETLNGDADANEINGLGGNDTLNGNGDDDTIFGGSGNDTLDGGLGADTLQGDGGDDSYRVLASYSGQRVIEGTGQGTADRVLFEDLALADVTFETQGSDLRVNWTNNSSSHHLLISNNGTNVETLEFADGSVVGRATPLSSGAVSLSADSTGAKIHGGVNVYQVSGGSGNDDITGGSHLYGYLGDDTYRIGKDGVENFIVYETGGTDRVIFEDLNLADVSIAFGTHGWGALGNTLQISWTNGNSGPESLTIANEGADIESFEFADGNVISSFVERSNGMLSLFGDNSGNKIHGTGTNVYQVSGGNGDDDLTGGSHLYGYLGNDTYRIGQDGIENFIVYESGGTDRVIFEDLNLSDMSFAFGSHGWAALGNTLLVSWTNATSGSESLTIANKGADIESFEFADGSVVRSIVERGNGTVSLFGDNSGSKIHGGANVYQVAGGSGNDDISGGSHLYGYQGDDIYRISKDGSENYIVYETGGTDRIVFQDLNLTDVSFSFGSHGWAALGNILNISWTNSNSGQESLIIANNGADIESFEFADGSVVSSIIQRSNGLTSLIGNNDGTTIYSDGDGIYEVSGGSGNDDLSGGSLLYGYQGDDTYRIGEDGVENYIVYETGGTDRVIFEDLNLADVSFAYGSHGWAALGDTLNASWTNANGGQESLIIANRGADIETFEFADGSELTYAQLTALV